MSQTIREWRPCTVTTVASCGKGLASIKEGGNLAPEGTPGHSRAGVVQGSQAGCSEGSGEPGWAARASWVQSPKEPGLAGVSESQRGAVLCHGVAFQTLEPLWA